MLGSAMLKILLSSTFVQPPSYAYAVHFFRCSSAQNRICIRGLGGGDADDSPKILPMLSSTDCFACIVACGWWYPDWYVASDSCEGAKWPQRDDSI